MNRYIILINLFLLTSTILYSQTINVQLPSEANKNYALVLNFGVKQDTVAKSSFNFAGSTTITIPSKYADYSGIGYLKIEKGKTINLVINKENFSITQNQNSALRFTNSAENNYLYYSQANPAIKKDTALYANRFLTLFAFIQDLAKAGNGQLSLPQKAEIRYFALHKLDVDALYYSGLWFYGIDGIIKLSPIQEDTGRNMVEVLKRVKTQKVFEALVENLITITDQFGWDDTFNIIIPYVEKSGRIETPQGNIYKAFALAKVTKGSIAPKLTGLKTKNGEFDKTLLFFYDPGCHNCADEKQLLISKFNELKAKKIRIVSVSSDSDKKRYFEEASKLPWADKLCDFKGFAGSNFINYGIMGTPTFFLLDKNGKVIGRYAKVSQIPF